MAGIVANLTTISLDASTIANVKGFTIPGAENKEFDITTLDSTIEEFKKSTLKVAKDFVFNLLLDTTDGTITEDDEGEWVITLPKQESGSTVQSSFTFQGFVRMVGDIEGDEAGDTGLTQEITIRATSVVTVVLES